VLSRSLLFAAVVLFTTTAITHAPAVWRGPPQMLAVLDPETRDWVIGLRNKSAAHAATRLTASPLRSTVGIWLEPLTTHRE
jgi:hypothetical protein